MYGGVNNARKNEFNVLAQFLSLFTVCRAKKHLPKDHLIIQEMTSKIHNTECVYCASIHSYLPSSVLIHKV